MCFYVQQINAHLRMTVFVHAHTGPLEAGATRGSKDSRPNVEEVPTFCDYYDVSLKDPARA